MSGSDSAEFENVISSSEACVNELQPELQREKSDSNPPLALILEDDVTQLQLLVHHLASFGLETVSAMSLQDAEQKLQENQFQLGIFDIQLPDGNSIELCEQIDDDPELMGLPIIMLSSAPEEHVVRKIRSAGACYFISKPYDPNVLIAMIEQALGQGL